MSEFGPPDTSEKAIRFGCGFVAGLLLGVSALLDWADESARTWVLGGVGAALVCGYLAMRHGDGFWEGLVKWFGRWP